MRALLDYAKAVATLAVLLLIIIGGLWLLALLPDDCGATAGAWCAR